MSQILEDRGKKNYKPTSAAVRNNFSHYERKATSISSLLSPSPWSRLPLPASYDLHGHRGVQDLCWIFVSAIYRIKKPILAFH